MSDKKPMPGVAVHVIKAVSPATIQKADTPSQLSSQSQASASEWIEPPVDLRGLKVMVTQSTILPQCVRAYRSNIAGFGIGVRYKSGFDDNDKSALAEYERAEEIIELLNMDMDTKEVFEDAIEARETYGISYLEAVRNNVGEITGIDFIKDTPTVRKSTPLEPYLEVEYFYKGKSVTRPRKFCKYKQQVGGKVVYFKEIGDPRIMDNRSGEYVKEGETLDLKYQANEILEFAIGTDTYGEVRWIGQILGIDGSRKAEGLNNRYFEEGRHTPLLIMVKGGTLTDDSFTKLQEYMNAIKGEQGQHAFMVLEVENTDNRTDFSDTKPPEIEIKDLAAILQKDELFQEYIDNGRRKAQSSFLLPDLYVGYTTDFNRATAQTAMEVTEKQVFQPERVSIAWAINNKLLAGYKFKYVEAYLKEPDITNPDDLTKILNVTERAGGLTPNKAKEITHKILGEISEDYTEPWGDIPLAISRPQLGQPAANPAAVGQLETQIKKATAALGDTDAVVAVMKEVRSLLLNIQKGEKS